MFLVVFGERRDGERARVRIVSLRSAQKRTRLGHRVWGSRFRIWGRGLHHAPTRGFGVWVQGRALPRSISRSRGGGRAPRVSWSEIRVQSSGFRDVFRVEPSAEISVEFKFRVQGYTQVGDSGFGFRIEGFGLRVPGLGFRVQTQRRSIKMVVGVPCFYYQLLSIDYYQFLLRWCLVFRVKPSAEVSVGFGRGARSPSSLP